MRPCWVVNGLWRCVRLGIMLCGRPFIHTSIKVTNSVLLVAASARLRAKSMLSAWR
jgi:hypothetical protein